AASTAPPTAARPGSRSSKRTPTPAPSTSASTPTTRASSSPPCGRPAAAPGSSSAAGPAGGLPPPPAAPPPRKQPAPPAPPPPPPTRGEKSPGKGLPKGPWGRVGLAIAPSDGRRVYALIEAEQGGLYRSDDGGDSWDLVNPSRYLRVRPWYFSVL